MTKDKILEKVKELLGTKGTLLYLTKFGSHLYGTDSPQSYTDVKGIFLPSLESLIMGEAPKSVNFTSGENGSKNSKEDVDIELWSIQYFTKLLKQAETGALDLFFSWTNIDTLIYFDNKLFDFFGNVEKLIETNELMKCAYVKYAIGQAKKYGIKGSRVGVLKRVSEWDGNITGKLGDVADELLEKFGDTSFFFKKFFKDISGLVVCGKVHQYSIKTKEFIDRIKKDYEKYGERAKLAELNEGIDWKALSHAVRAIFQMEQLINEGSITFPLLPHEVTILKNIKFGKIPFERVEEIIITGIENLDESIKNVTIYGTFNEEFVRDFVKHLYNL